MHKMIHKVMHRLLGHLKLLCFICLSGSLYTCSSDQQTPFPNLNGPLEATSLPLADPPHSSIERYAHGGSNSLAILLQDEDSSWLGLAHGLKSVGVPFVITTELTVALAHDVILVYPPMTGANTRSETLNLLAEHVQKGHTLIGFSAMKRGADEVFGFDSFQEHDDLQTMEILEGAFTQQFIKDPQESVLNLDGSSDVSSGVSFDNPEYPPLAVYNDGSAAIVYNVYSGLEGTGYAYAIGFDLGYHILRAQNGRSEDIAVAYVNHYRPQTDTLLRLIAQIYKQGESNPIQVLSSPHNKEFTALVTHDIDYKQSLLNVLEYAQFEHAQEIPATYFIQTKYVSDYYETQFFTATSQPIIEELVRLGMEVASHTVAHSRVFNKMPLGTGKETYPRYQPYVRSFDVVDNASIAGELRVSRFLLEHLSGQDVSSFRPGHLSLPTSLPQMLEATDYRFSSSITANQALTHLPYQMMVSRRYRTESKIFEFPVTIEDEKGRLLDRLDEAIAVSNKISRHGGLVNILIHTDVTGQKLAFEQQYLAEFKDRAWFTSLSKYGEWWQTRDSLLIDVEEPSQSERVISLRAEQNIDGLSLSIPPAWSLESENLGVRQEGMTLIFEEFQGLKRVNISRSTSP